MVISPCDKFGDVLNSKVTIGASRQDVVADVMRIVERALLFQHWSWDVTGDAVSAS